MLALKLFSRPPHFSFSVVCYFAGADDPCYREKDLERVEAI